MKKKYLFMSSFFLIGTVFTLVVYFSYRNYHDETSQAVQEELNTVDTVKEIRVNSSMTYMVEKYDIDTDVLTTEEETVPAELAGKTREELEQYISDYNLGLDKEKSAETPDRVELVSFSKDKIVVRETYSGAEEETGFYLKLDQGEVVIYHRDQVTPYENTGIQADMLPEEERKKLEEGYFVEDEKELYSILENLSS